MHRRVPAAVQLRCLNSVTGLDQESRRPGQVVVRLSVFRFTLPLCTLKLQNTTGRSASALIYCRITEKALRNSKYARLQDSRTRLSTSFVSHLPKRSRVTWNMFKPILQTERKKKIRDWDFCWQIFLDIIPKIF